MIDEEVVSFLILCLANASVSFTVARSEVFRPARDWFFNRSTNKVFEFISDLIHCPYCLSHWVAFLMVLIWQQKFTNTFVPVIDFAVTIFAIVGLSAIVIKAIDK